jgi:hypothetical protein
MKLMEMRDKGTQVKTMKGIKDHEVRSYGCAIYFSFIHLVLNLNRIISGSDRFIL